MIGVAKYAEDSILRDYALILGWQVNMDEQQRLDELEKRILDIERWNNTLATKLKDILNKLIEKREQENKFKELDKLYQERFQTREVEEDEINIGRPNTIQREY